MFNEFYFEPIFNRKQQNHETKLKKSWKVNTHMHIYIYIIYISTYTFVLKKTKKKHMYINIKEN